MQRRKSLGYLAAMGASPWLTPLHSLVTAQASVMKRKIPSSGEMLPIVGVGTWQTFDVGTSPSERSPLKEVLKTLLEKGGTVIDSSPMYGRSEGVVGELSTELGINEKLFVATKVWTSGRQSGIDQMNRSFSLLRRKTIDLMQIHNLVDWRTHLATLRPWKEDGKIRYLGITHYTESSYDNIEQILKTEKLDFLQINYSIVSRQVEERILPLAQDKGVAMIINQPYEGGSLFRSVRGKELPGYAKEFDCTSWGQFFLKFILGHPAVTCVIPGTDNPRHMIDNMGAGLGKLPDQEMRKRMIAEV
ncbi:MAG: aldo/keto reductase [Cyclobacteriaceae bacterium]|nr:aldo/keto reductase [Cyclobacteriaceae bacterium SS2]